MTHWPRGGYPAANIPASELKPPPANMISKAEQPKYTESDMRVLTEAALRLGRKEAAEQVAQIHKPFPFGKTCPECHTKWPCATASACLSLAYPGRQAASSPRTDLSVDTDLPQGTQAVREPQGGSDG